MKFFTPYQYYENNMLPIDDKVIYSIMKNCINPQIVESKSTNEHIYKKLYKTKYDHTDIEQLNKKEKEVINYVRSIYMADYIANNKKESDLIALIKQRKSYLAISIKEKEQEEIAYRYYFAPNPENMHEIVKNLTAEFVSRKTPVIFKFQREPKWNEACDRIILYADSKHQKEIEKGIQNVYQRKPYLFKGSERPLPWIYTTNIPNVYLAPEKEGKSYGGEFAQALLDASNIFFYLYGIDREKPNLKLNTNEEYTKAYKDLEQIVCSTLLVKGLLLDKNGKKILPKNKTFSITYKGERITYEYDDFNTFYNNTFYNNDEIEFRYIKDDKIVSATFFQNKNSKKLLKTWFYYPLNLVNYPEYKNYVKIECLTKSEKTQRTINQFSRICK